ncbi:MAG: hypothetical protein KDN20_01145, partial [Verrucomicrobiae bacterium]|nr:hypothetical protein [Verrucomicrobiae bacterium]
SPSPASAQPADTSPKPAASASSELPSDDAILGRLPELSTEYVRDLLGIYARLNNAKMITELTGELRKRNPEGTLSQSDAAIATDAMDLGTNEPPSPHEILENKIDALVVAEKFAEAIVLMEKERTTTFAGQGFPFEVDLGDAYGTVGNLTAAREAYSRVISAKGASADQKALAQAGMVEIDKLEAVNQGYELIKVKKSEAALAHAEALKQKYPEDLEVQLLYAQALVPNYHYMEALPMLEALKAKFFVGQPYPAQDALAEALRAVGRFDDAEQAYDELSKDATVPAHVREEAVVGRREVSKMRAANVQADLEFLSEDEGDARLANFSASAPIGSNLYAGVRGWAYDVELTKERSIRQGSGDFLGAVAFVRQYLDDRLSYVEGRVGGGEHDRVTFGASYGKEAPYIGVLGYEISIDGNTPAIDSLQLIALNGTENKVSASVTAPLPNRFEATAGVWGRQVKAGDATLGDGWGAYFEVGRPVWENITETRQIYLSYRGEYDRFDADRLSPNEVRSLNYAGEVVDGSSLGMDLIEPRYSPHGLHLTYEAQVNKQLFVYAGTGLFFDFSDEEWDYQFTTGLDYSLTDTLDLIIEGGYYSDGTGASNDNSAVMVGTIGLRKFY